MNWYKLLKLSFKRLSMSGEFWIQEDGSTVFADGNIGDTNHEGYVIQNLLSQYDMDWDDNQVDINNPRFIEEYAKQNTQECLDLLKEQNSIDLQTLQQILQQIETGIDISKSPLIINAIVNDITLYDIFLIQGASPEEATIMSGGGDPRVYAQVHWKWKIIRGNNVETNTLTNQDLKAISNGLWDAYQEEVEQGIYSIFVLANNKWFTDIPWEIIKSEDIAKLIEYTNTYQTANKKTRIKMASPIVVDNAFGEGIHYMDIGHESVEYSLSNNEDYMFIINMDGSLEKKESNNSKDTHDIHWRDKWQTKDFLARGRIEINPRYGVKISLVLSEKVTSSFMRAEAAKRRAEQILEEHYPGANIYFYPPSILRN